MDKLLNDFKNYSLHLLSKDNVPSLSRFILRVNNQVHMGTNTIIYKDLPKTIDVDKDSYSTSFFYVVKNKKNEIIGSIKAQRWDRKSKLPIEDDFDIKIDEVVNNMNYNPYEIWHIGRFAIDQQMIRKDPDLCKHRITILKLLLVNAFQHICTHRNNIALAECDKKLFDKLKLMQINSSQIGESKTYLGSETVPIFNTANGVHEFVKINQHLTYSPTQQELQYA